jgi:hypothetical protein
MSATEQQQHPQDRDKDGESRSERVEHLGDDEGPDVVGHMGQMGAPVGHRGRV